MLLRSFTVYMCNWPPSDLQFSYIKKQMEKRLYVQTVKKKKKHLMKNKNGNSHSKVSIGPINQSKPGTQCEEWRRGASRVFCHAVRCLGKWARHFQDGAGTHMWDRALAGWRHRSHCSFQSMRAILSGIGSRQYMEPLWLQHRSPHPGPISGGPSVAFSTLHPGLTYLDEPNTHPTMQVAIWHFYSLLKVFSNSLHREEPLHPFFVFYIERAFFCSLEEGALVHAFSGSRASHLWTLYMMFPRWTF